MAIYHFSVKTISRGAGRSAVACSAYRSGEKLVDERQGKEQDYTRKTGVEFKKIYAPEHTNPELLDRNQLWNAVEKVERRKDANLAREFEIAFPHELDKSQREKMLNELCQELVKRHGVIVDAVIHAPHTQSGSDERNYHAHIMFTGRQIDPETGDFAKKRNRDFNKENSSQTVNQWRETFADITNQHLAQAGYLTQVDHRSYAEQDNGLQATIHEGSKVTQLRRQGINTEISISNDLIKQRNAEKLQNEQIITGLDQEIVKNEIHLSRLNLQRDLQQSKQNKITDAQTALQTYGKTLQELSNTLFLKEKNKKIEDAKVWVAKIEEMKANTPLFIGKKEHLAKIEKEVKQYQEMRNNFIIFNEKGVTAEHQQQAQMLLKEQQPNLIRHAQDAKKVLIQHVLEDAQTHIHPDISILAEPNHSYHGKILQSNDQGSVQLTEKGMVYHPRLNDLHINKNYSLDYDKNHVSIREHPEIKIKTDRDRHNERER